MPMNYGKIAIEEAWQLPECITPSQTCSFDFVLPNFNPPRKHASVTFLICSRFIVVAHEAANYAPVGSEKKLGDNLVDIHKQRLDLMDKYGVEMQVLSLTSPGPQGTHPPPSPTASNLIVGYSDPKEAAALATRANDVLV